MSFAVCLCYFELTGAWRSRKNWTEDDSLMAGIALRASLSVLFSLSDPIPSVVLKSGYTRANSQCCTKSPTKCDINSGKQFSSGRVVNATKQFD